MFAGTNGEDRLTDRRVGRIGCRRYRSRQIVYVAFAAADNRVGRKVRGRYMGNFHPIGSGLIMALKFEVMCVYLGHGESSGSGKKTPNKDGSAGQKKGLRRWPRRVSMVEHPR